VKSAKNGTFQFNLVPQAKIFFTEVLLVIRWFSFTNGGTLLVAQLVEALRHKPEGDGFDFLLT